MNRTRLSELPETVRGFLKEALQGDGLVLEDDLGQPQGRVVPLEAETAPKRDKATQLPTWPGTVTGPLHRDEIYEEV